VAPRVQFTHKQLCNQSRERKLLLRALIVLFAKAAEEIDATRPDDSPYVAYLPIDTRRRRRHWRIKRRFADSLEWKISRRVAPGRIFPFYAETYGGDYSSGGASWCGRVRFVCVVETTARLLAWLDYVIICAIPE